MSRSVAVLWFRRDLRVHDHPGLHHALDAFDAVVPVFVVDDRILGGRWRSPNRLWFLSGAVRSLGEQLAERGAPLHVLTGDPVDVVPRFAAETGATTVIVSRDYSPYGRRRDDGVRAALTTSGVRFAAGRGLLVHEPEAITRDAGGAFTVFSPFHRRWLALPRRPVLAAPEAIPSRGDRPSGGGPAAAGGARPGATWPGRSRTSAATAGEIDILFGRPEPTADPDLLLEPTEAAARERLAVWASSPALRDYDTGRDRLDLPGTSRLSQDVRFGLLSPLEVVAAVEAAASAGPGPSRFISELAWRDFYGHLLFHEPRVARESFRRELDGIADSTDSELVDAWKTGRTGYPIVDAAMRQLLATGWMHNRGRMIVASFLTKHLGVDWRVGEAHFMTHLVDGDPASNNGGWQWAASTGTDPQPYFRIFNPTLQGRRHDPDGAYIRRWVEELADREDLGDAIHEPGAGGYLTPVVDHAEARRRALARYADRRSPE